MGPPFKGNQVKIAEDGEILVKGENVMLGYWNKKKETENAIKDGWLYTGDIGEIDSTDGYLKITDRKKDIIVTAGGDNISPAKIENKEKISKIINTINDKLTLVEKVKKFYLIDENFSIENGLLTPTMKVKRNKVIVKYKNILEKLYQK